MYTTKHICAYFDVTHETVKRWTKEFSDYLSPTALPDKGRQRQFTEQDVRVFSLVHGMKKQGLVFEDIHVALASGQRGDLPEEAATELTTIPASGAMGAALAHAQDLQLALNQERTLRIRSEAREDLLKEQLKEAQQEIARLNQLLGAKSNGSNPA